MLGLLIPYLNLIEYLYDLFVIIINITQYLFHYCLYLSLPNIPEIYQNKWFSIKLYELTNLCVDTFKHVYLT